MGAATMAIVAPIPGKLGRHLDMLRRRLDLDGAGSLPAHIPLVGPFRVEPSFLPLEQHCWEVCHATAPFEIELGALVLDEKERLAYLEVAGGQEPLLALREALLTGAYAPPRDREPYTPRAVVARLAFRDHAAPSDWEDGAARIGRSFELERVELMAQYPDGSWYQRDFYTLDRAVSRA